MATAVRTGDAKLVLSASDASDGSLRRVRAGAAESGTPHAAIPYTKFELGRIIGRAPTGTVAILDAGLSARFIKGLAEAEPGRYDETLNLLSTGKRKSRRTAR